jgi:SAM-dependent methyltransferase
MFPWLVRDPDDDVPAVRALRARLDEFYATTDAYPVFRETPDNSPYFRAMAPYLNGLLARTADKVRVLELGAGRASFPSHFADLRGRIEFHAQDVTPQNRDYLAGVADRVIIGDLSGIDGEYDLIFSTYVFEHVATPGPFLGHVRRLLRPGGVHVVVCPRYDVPGYLCPSLRHRPLATRLGLHVKLAASRAAALLGGRPRFWVNTDPAVFHGPWYTDADAVHVVSQSDVARWHRRHGFKVRRLPLESSGVRAWVLRRFLTTSLACTKLD